MDYEVSCFVTFSNDVPESRQRLLEAVKVFEEAIRQAGMAFTLEINGLREGCCVVRTVHSGGL